MKYKLELIAKLLVEPRAGRLGGNKEVERIMDVFIVERNWAGLAKSHLPQVVIPCALTRQEIAK